MNRQTISLGRILNIPIGLDYSWFLVFALLTWTLATSYFPAEFRNWSTGQYWIVGAATAILMFGSVLLHELGHSAIALRYKIPVRSITLFIFGGVAQIASEPPSAGAEFWIAIAGPVVSFALAIFFGLLQPVVGAVAPLLALANPGQWAALLHDRAGRQGHGPVDPAPHQGSTPDGMADDHSCAGHDTGAADETGSTQCGTMDSHGRDG